MKRLIILLIFLLISCNQKELKNECDEIYQTSSIALLQDYEKKSESGKDITIKFLLAMYYSNKECKADLEFKLKL